MADSSRQRTQVLGPFARVWALNAVLAAAAAIVLFLGRGSTAPISALPVVVWPGLAVLFGAAEVWVVHVQFRREAHTVSLSELPLTIGLFFLSPPLLVAAQVLGAAPVLIFHRRQAPLKLIFNLAQLTLCTGAAALAFRGLIGGTPSVGPRAWVSALAATALSAALGVITVSTAISLSEGRLAPGKWVPVMAFSLAGTLVNTCLALVGVVVMVNDVRAGLLLIVPAGALFGAYQAYTRERQKTERIEFLYNSGRTLASTAGQEAGILQLLQDALGEFRADVAQLTVQTGAGSPFDLRTTVRAGEIMELDQPVEPSTGDAVLERVMSADKGMILAPPHTDPAVVAFLGKRGIEDAIITALKAENRVMGTILVGSRMGGLGTFSEDDLNLLATLANQLGAAVENARLERVLHHQAFHDSLTSLANRPLFNERIEHAVAQRDSRVGILLVDIDDFKVVNDTLGHAAGDQLLVSVARRLQAVVRASDTAARLGGDEFALLVEDLRDLEDATMAAGRVVETLRQPFSLNGQEIRVTASIGIATNLDAPADAGGLLMQADVAMYAAKRSDAGPGGYQVFQPSMQDEVTERHALREDLHRAIERGELVNHYQPLVSLETGEVVGAEALVRWQSKERGLVSPAYFIRVAEESGLILELGRWVLREACGQARDWQREFPARKALGVSVNLSAVQLRQPGFVDDVVRVLQQTGLEPGLLTLEITESTFMDDTRSAIARLRELRGLGIRLELDDFGTGYSSLSILRDLPLDGLKIDKSFVDGLHAAGDRPAFLQAIVRLAQALDLDMVGEGIEQEPQADALRGMGCQRGQGYFFARPLPAQDMIAFLHQAEPSSGAVLPLPSRRR